MSDGDDVDVGEFYCPECDRRCTRGPSGTEYGHDRGPGYGGPRPRCPRRPAEVDPSGERGPL